MDKLLSLYNFFKTDKRKERFDIILEPLQAITQLALMAFCPYGSKLTISNNLLFIQSANWGQGMLRSFNNDKRDDLFYLFNSIIRFNKFYQTNRRYLSAIYRNMLVYFTVSYRKIHYQSP